MEKSAKASFSQRVLEKTERAEFSRKIPRERTHRKNCERIFPSPAKLVEHLSMQLMPSELVPKFHHVLIHFEFYLAN